MRLFIACIVGWLSIVALSFLIGAALGPWIGILGIDRDTGIQVLRNVGPAAAVFLGIAIAIFVFNGGTFEHRPAVQSKSHNDNL